MVGPPSGLTSGWGVSDDGAPPPPERVHTPCRARAAVDPRSARGPARGARPGRGSHASRGWTFQRVILEFDDGSVYDSVDDGGAALSGTATDRRYRDSPEANIHLSCSEDLVGRKVVDGSKELTITGFYLDTSNPGASDDRRTCGSVDPDPQPPVACEDVSDASIASFRVALGLEGPFDEEGNLLDGRQAVELLQDTFCEVTVHLTSYELPGDADRPSDDTFGDQTLFDTDAQTLEPGDGFELAVDLPDCGFQIDLYVADETVQTPPHHGPDRPGVYLLDFDLGRLGDPCDDEEPVDPQPEPDPVLGVELVKANDADDDGTFTGVEEAGAPGQDVAFQVRIENTGDVPGQVVSLTDTFVDAAGETQVVDLLADGVLSCGGFDVSSELLDADGGYVLCTFTLPGYAPDWSDELVNTVEVELVDPQEQADPATDEDDSTVTSPQQPPVVEPDPASITLAKSALVEPGDDGLKVVELGADGTVEVTYLYTVLNDGQTVLDLTSFSDDRIDDLDLSALEATTLAPGESTTATVTVTLSAADFTDGLHTNVATVTGVSPDGQEVEDTTTETVVELEVLDEVTEPDPDEDVEPQPGTDPDGDDPQGDRAPADEGDTEVLAEVEVRAADTEGQPTTVATADELPRTGASSTSLALFALLLMLLGGALLRSATTAAGHREGAIA